MTTSGERAQAGDLLLVAIVEMAPGKAEAGERYEDAVLDLLDRHGGSVERRLRGTDARTEVHLIRFRSRAGYESFMIDPDRVAHRARLGDAAPTTRVIEVREASHRFDSFFSSAARSFMAARSCSEKPSDFPVTLPRGVRAHGWHLITIMTAER